MAASPAQALVPPTITHQGRLFDVQGVPVVGTVDLLFALYDAPDALAPIWMEMHSIDFDDGYFSVQLGALDPVEPIFNGSTRWLGITVGADAEMTPRAEIASVPYALVCNDAVGDINPLSINISGFGPVVDAGGKWVGDPSGLIGPAGPAGPAGADGAAGPAGPAGPAGADGAAGAAGPAGPAGADGAVGPAGAAGAAGADGAIGPAGPAGPAGAVGPAGPAGAVGAVGPVGPAGAVGPAGPAGPAGAVGAIGPQGPAGPQGAMGLPGAPGAIGPQGPAGPQGANGAQGIQGIQGVQGVQGIPGPTSIAACPAGYTTVDLTRSTLCIRRDNTVATWAGAMNRCYSTNSGGELCTYSQMRRSCNNGGLQPTGGGWLADRIADDDVLITNGVDCNNFDGVSGTLNGATQVGMYCCLEWMKY